MITEPLFYLPVALVVLSFGFGAWVAARAPWRKGVRIAVTATAFTIGIAALLWIFLFVVLYGVISRMYPQGH